MSAIAGATADAAVTAGTIYSGAEVAGAAFQIGRAVFAPAARTELLSAVEVASAGEARVAGRLWVTTGEPIFAQRGAGGVIGRISSVMTTVYRAPALKLKGPNAGKFAANLERYLISEGEPSIVSNVHVVIR